MWKYVSFLWQRHFAPGSQSCSDMEVTMEKPAIEGGGPVRETPIYYGHQYIDEADIQAVTEVLKSDFLTCGPKIGELEKSYAR